MTLVATAMEFAMVIWMCGATMMSFVMRTLLEKYSVCNAGGWVFAEAWSP
jgi:hypothetical protein